MIETVAYGKKPLDAVALATQSGEASVRFDFYSFVSIVTITVVSLFLCTERVQLFGEWFARSHREVVGSFESSVFNDVHSAR